MLWFGRLVSLSHQTPLAPYDTYFFWMIFVPISFGFFFGFFLSGRLKRHEIGLPLAFTPLIYLVATQMINYFGSWEVVVLVCYAIATLTAYYIGFRYKLRLTKGKPS
jgi:hypothetical protein